MFNRIKVQLKKWNIIPNEKSRMLELENKVKKNVAAEKSIEKNHQKTSLLKKEEIQRVSLLDLKNLEKNPPVWKSIQIDYSNKLAFAVARYRIGSSKYRETVRTALVGGVVFLSAIVYSVVSGLEERKRRYELQQKSFEKLDKLIKAKFNLPDDQVLLIALDAYLWDNETVILQHLYQNCPNLMVFNALEVFEYASKGLKGLESSHIVPSQKFIDFIRYFRLYPLLTKRIIQYGQDDKEKILVRLIQARDEFNYREKVELGRLLDGAPGVVDYVLEPKMSILEAVKILEKEDYGFLAEKRTKQCSILFKNLLNSEISLLETKS